MAGLAVETTKRILFDKGPHILREQYFEKYQEKPGNMDRLQASAGPHKSGDDPHIGGRALDIILRANIPYEYYIGNFLVESFLRARTEMGWISLVYNHSEWNSSGNKFPHKRFVKTKDGETTNIDDGIFGHITHLHIEWGEAGVASANFEEALINALHPDESGAYS